MTHPSTSSGVLCILSAGVLLLAGLPLARGSDSVPSAFSGLEELAWPPGDDEAPSVRDQMLFLPQQLAAVERAKRTGLASDMGRGGNNGGGPSLSIVNPLDVLRQRLLLEMVRRRMRQSEDQILANREMLNSVGKRSVAAQQPAPQADLRGLLLRRHVRSARPEDEDTHAARQSTETHPATHAQQHSRGGATAL